MPQPLDQFANAIGKFADATTEFIKLEPLEDFSERTTIVKLWVIFGIGIWSIAIGSFGYLFITEVTPIEILNFAKIPQSTVWLAFGAAMIWWGVTKVGVRPKDGQK